MSDQKHPELHVNETPNDDLMDTGKAFGAFFGVLFVIAIIATIVTMYK